MNEAAFDKLIEEYKDKIRQNNKTIEADDYFNLDNPGNKWDKIEYEDGDDYNFGG